MTFRVGMKVECVDSHPGHGFSWEHQEAPVLGSKYTVTRVFIDEEGDEIIHLQEIARDRVSQEWWGDDVGYRASRFRPIVERKTSIEVFQRMLNPSEVEA